MEIDLNEDDAISNKSADNNMAIGFKLKSSCLSDISDNSQMKDPYSLRGFAPQ